MAVITSGGIDSLDRIPLMVLPETISSKILKELTPLPQVNDSMTPKEVSKAMDERERGYQKQLKKLSDEEERNADGAGLATHDGNRGGKTFMKNKPEHLCLSINEIGLSVALANMLNNADIRTLEDLSLVDLSRYRNFKGRRMKELRESLKEVLE